VMEEEEIDSNKEAWALVMVEVVIDSNMEV